VIDDPIVPCHQTAAKAYEIQAVQVLIAYIHAAARFSAKVTWLRVVEANVYSYWPRISLPRLLCHLTLPEPTTIGHLKLIRKDTRSTQPKPIPPATPPRTVHNVGVNVIDNETLGSNPEIKNVIATDLAGRYLIISDRGHHKYIFVMCDYDSNYINAILITSRKGCILVRAFTECYDSLKKNCPAARLLHLVDEVSHELVAVIEAHFITIRSGADPDFPEN